MMTSEDIPEDVELVLDAIFRLSSPTSPNMFDYLNAAKF